jgi:hypothetical protein
MGFLQGLGKLIAGEPVFDETPSDDDDRDRVKQSVQPDSAPIRSTFVDEHGKKIVPDVSFKKFKSNVNGPKDTTWAWVKNNSPFEIEIVKIEALGQHQDIRRRLRPNEEHEVKIYDGQVITHDHDHHAKMYVKIHENDDLFLTEYEVEYNRESNGTYTLEEFHHTYQPRDI